MITSLPYFGDSVNSISVDVLSALATMVPTWHTILKNIHKTQSKDENEDTFCI